MKKLLSLCLVLLLSFLLVACGGGTSSSAQGEDPAPVAGDNADSSPAQTDPAPAETAGEGDLGDYHVRVTGYRLAKDYDGKDAVILDYEFTNNGEDAASAMFSLSFKLYQDGIELERAVVLDDSYDSDNELKDIKTGATLACQCAYVLGNTTSPVEVEISEWISFSDDVVAYVIDLATAQ